MRIKRIIPLLLSLLGLLSSLFAWILAGVKAHIDNVRTPVEGSIWIGTSPPDATLEFVLLFLGLAIVLCGLVQFRSHLRFSVPQVIFGLLIVVISAFFAFKAATLGYGEVSIVYYLVYLVIPLGLAVFGLGIAQIVKMVRKE
jgi:hypothetical protein